MILSRQLYRASRIARVFADGDSNNSRQLPRPPSCSSISTVVLVRVTMLPLICQLFTIIGAINLCYTTTPVHSLRL